MSDHYIRPWFQKRAFQPRIDSRMEERILGKCPEGMEVLHGLLRACLCVPTDMETYQRFRRLILTSVKSLDNITSYRAKKQHTISVDIQYNTSKTGVMFYKLNIGVKLVSMTQKEHNRINKLLENIRLSL